MKLNVTIKDYTQMSLKELEKEHTKEGQKLLDMMNDNRYSKQDLEKQKSFVDTLYKMICKKNRNISKIKG